MAKFNFNLRNPGKSNNCLIYLIIRYNSNKLVYPTSERINPKYWEFDKSKRNFQRAVTTRQFPEYPEFNARLDYIEQRAKAVFRKFLNDHENRPPTLTELKKKLDHEFKKEPLHTNLSFFEFIEKFIEEAGNRIYDATSKPISRSTILNYKNTYQLLKEFKKRKGRVIDFDNIDLDFYYDFIDFLTQEQQYSLNTVGKQIKTLKAFLNDATERGINKNLAFKNKRFKIVSEDSVAIYLDKQELNEIFQLDLSSNKRLEKVRDLFIVGCWTGLRFSDFSTIQPENFKGDYLEIKTQKTGEPVVLPIHPTVREIMNRYEGQYYNNLPPAISNAKMNEYLKEIGKMVKSLHQPITVGKTKAGFKINSKKKKYELITTHTARRSFATNLYLDGFPSISIMKITGHRTEGAFLSYIKITPRDNAELLMNHWKKSS